MTKSVAAGAVAADIEAMTIEKAKGSIVPALLWEISPQDEAALDRWIGVPELYRKVAIKVRRDD
ncbi:MAG TPA: gamma-glutamylcyclotransferase, partial [Candidatus Izemoplasmatales bacterium]|nr:gamma-glutamylcyclotransferase [Candidatus Izemoplasmatales bacterium]